MDITFILLFLSSGALFIADLNHKISSQKEKIHELEKDIEKLKREIK